MPVQRGIPILRLHLSRAKCARQIPLGLAHAGGWCSGRSLCPLVKESVTKLVPSAEADSVLPTFAFPALTCWANECRRCATRVDSSHCYTTSPSFVTASEKRGTAG